MHVQNPPKAWSNGIAARNHETVDPIFGPADE